MHTQEASRTGFQPRNPNFVWSAPLNSTWSTFSICTTMSEPGKYIYIYAHIYIYINIYIYLLVSSGRVLSWIVSTVDCLYRLSLSVLSTLLSFKSLFSLLSRLSIISILSLVSIVCKRPDWGVYSKRERQVCIASTCLLVNFREASL